MARRHLGTNWNRKQLDDTNDNFKELYGQKEALEKIANNAEKNSQDALSEVKKQGDFYKKDVEDLKKETVDIANDAKDTADRAEMIAQDTNDNMNNIIGGQTDSAEIIQARKPFNEEAFKTVGERLNNIDKKIIDVTKISEGKTTVSYDEFGANGEPKYYDFVTKKFYLDKNFTKVYTHDDGIEINKCHKFANEHGYDVVNTSGCYVIRFTEIIEVKTSVINTGCQIIVDENNLTTLDKNGFMKVTYDEKWVDVTSKINKNNLLKYMKQESKYIPELSKYAGYYCHILNKNKRVGMRIGANADIGIHMQDWFEILKGGHIDGEITWDFEDVTTVLVKKMPSEYLKIEGGDYLFTGSLMYEEYEGNYLSSGIVSDRPNLLFKNVNFDFIDADKEESIACSPGFIEILEGCNIFWDNVNIATKKDIVVDGVSRGNYGYSARLINNWQMNRVRNTGKEGNFSGMGTNLVKNWVIKNSELDKIDCHLYAWNVFILNSDIKRKGVSLSGGGILFMFNTKVSHKVDYIQFRGDYGARWEGEIYIYNGEFFPSEKNAETSIFRFPPLDGDYGYNITFANKIVVKGFNFNYKYAIENNQAAKLFKFRAAEKLSNEYVTIPEIMDIEDVTVSYRNRGVEIGNLDNLHIRRVKKSANFSVAKNDVKLTTNATYRFKNIQTTKMVDYTDGLAKHILLDGDYSDAYTNLSVVPKIIIEQTDNLNVGIGSSICEFIFNDCKINLVQGFKNGDGRSIVIFNQSFVMPDILLKLPALNFKNNLVIYNNTYFDAIKIKGTYDLLQTKVGQLGIFVENNTEVRLYQGFHNGSMLSRSLVSYLKETTKFTDKTNTLLKELRLSTDNYSYGEYKLL